MQAKQKIITHAYKAESILTYLQTNLNADMPPDVVEALLQNALKNINKICDIAESKKEK